MQRRLKVKVKVDGLIEAEIAAVFLAAKEGDVLLREFEVRVRVSEKGLFKTVIGIRQMKVVAVVGGSNLAFEILESL